MWARGRASAGLAAPTIVRTGAAGGARPSKRRRGERARPRGTTLWGGGEGQDTCGSQLAFYTSIIKASTSLWRLARRPPSPTAPARHPLGFVWPSRFGGRLASINYPYMYVVRQSPNSDCSSFCERSRCALGHALAFLRRPTFPNLDTFLEIGIRLHHTLQMTPDTGKTS